MSDNIRWLPTRRWQGTRWDLLINDEYKGRVLRNREGCFYSANYEGDRPAFSINDAGRKLLAYAKDHLESSSKG